MLMLLVGADLRCMPLSVNSGIAAVLPLARRYIVLGFFFAFQWT